MAFRSLMDDLHERLRARGFENLRPAYGFVLLAARNSPLGVSDVGVLLGTTKQAASKLIDSLEAEGYARRIEDAGDARARRIELTKNGHRLLEAVEAIYTDLEREWADVVGARRVESMREDLTRLLLARHGGTLPPVRPTW